MKVGQSYLIQIRRRGVASRTFEYTGRLISDDGEELLLLSLESEGTRIRVDKAMVDSYRELLDHGE